MTMTSLPQPTVLARGVQTCQRDNRPKCRTKPTTDLCQRGQSAHTKATALPVLGCNVHKELRGRAKLESRGMKGRSAFSYSKQVCKPFSVRGQAVNSFGIFWLVYKSSVCNDSAQPLEKSSQRECLREWVWPCLNKTLFF